MALMSVDPHELTLCQHPHLDGTWEGVENKVDNGYLGVYTTSILTPHLLPTLLQVLEDIGALISLSRSQSADQIEQRLLEPSREDTH